MIPAKALNHDIDAAKEHAQHWQRVAKERHAAVLRAIAAQVDALDKRDFWADRAGDLEDLAELERTAERTQAA